MNTENSPQKKTGGQPRKEMQGKTFGEWTVLDTFRRVSYPSGQVHIQWWCQCSCGTLSWVSGAGMRQGTTTSCGHLIPSVEVGQMLGEMQITEVHRGYVNVRCRCHRIRRFSLSALSHSTRLTCGCIELDQLTLKGDPNLPPGVTTSTELFQWAGISRQAYFDYLHRRGLEQALANLAEHAEKKHPGEGWRIHAILPGPHDRLGG